ncbi:MAG: YlbF family regulator [Bacilli bacterium]|jgi:cell fate (sporulation/competence/biofilm development) regulator YmcA (YheA/YmcA/DUF963 family)
MGIDESLRKIIGAIEEADVYKRYVHILKQVSSNDDIKEKVNNIKNIQQSLVRQTVNKTNKVIELKEQLDSETKSLNDIPLYQDYISVSVELHDLLKLVTDKIQIYINDLNI